MRKLNSSIGQVGQASVLGLALLAMLIAGLFLVYNTGQVATEKTRLVDATDAAAYSSGVQVARNLNYIAYTNRAMVANHLAVGHMTSYMSWFDYLDDITDVAAYLAPVPGIGQIATAIDQAVDANDEINIVVSQVIATGIQGVNTAISLSQLNAVAGISLGAQNSIQDEVLASYKYVGKESAIARVTQVPDSMLESVTFVRAAAKYLSGQAELLQYIDATSVYTPGRDDNVMRDLIEASKELIEDESGHWMRDSDARDWEFGGLPLALFVKIEKDGTARGQYEVGSFGWNATDRVRVRVRTFGLFGGTKTIARSDGEASSDAWNYNGIYRYTSVKDSDPDEHVAHSSVAMASYSLDKARLMSSGEAIGVHDQSNNELFSVSCAEIYFHRPEAMPLLSSNRREYSNVFNPFWKVRLRSMNVCGDET